MNILKVPVNELHLAWPVAVTLLRKANVPGEELDETKAYEELEAGLMQLWLGEGQAFACLTCLHPGETGNYAQIFMLGGVKVRDWYVDLFLILYAWARGQKCEHLQIDYPRPGWKRLLSHLGFTELDKETLVKEIEK